MPNKRRFFNFAAAALELGKIRIALPISLSAFTGYIIEKESADITVTAPLLGVFLLACGSLAFNQIQEKDTDALMKRTAGRPLPAGRVTVKQAVLIAMVCLAAGVHCLYHYAGLAALSVGLITVAWYNLVYTPLKRKTAFAVIPGSLVGALPPAIGWAAAGGNLTDHRIIILSTFFFIGQIPHFWLLLLKLGEEYKEAGLPSMLDYFSLTQLKRITFWWVLWTGTIGLFLAFFGILQHDWSAGIIAALTLILILSFRGFLAAHGRHPDFKGAFIKINIYFLLVMILIWTDALT